MATEHEAERERNNGQWIDAQERGEQERRCAKETSGGEGKERARKRALQADTLECHGEQAKDCHARTANAKPSSSAFKASNCIYYKTIHYHTNKSCHRQPCPIFIFNGDNTSPT
eukprot:TRINITY_DN2888_c0_g1_i1.p1 TRINITY_DN2888_c0_g1~~TRINITY_DN2888_c0_g1_i1.p1  ORF type:complete len:114 (-),score=9.32 TRINITY_DN2888_c0_g1_i1:18-359(-)